MGQERQIEPSSRPDKLLYIAPDHPWLPWTSSGFLPALCRELQKRGRLYGALPSYATSSEGIQGYGRIRDTVRRVKGRLGLLPKREAWQCESDGYLGRLLQGLEPDTPVVYQYILPSYEPSLPLRRFLFQDLSLYDAHKTKSYGHHEFTETMLAAKATQLRAAYDGAEGIMTFSSYAADSLTRDFGYPREKITAIGCGAARSHRSSSPISRERYTAARILFVGRNFERKGGPLVADAFQIVRRAIPHATLEIVGPTEPPVSGEGIRFHGFVSDGEVAEIFGSASLFCMPAICEAWGMVYTEAADAGLPIAGIDAWAMRDIVVPGKTGLLVAERTPEALAEALITMLEDPDRLCEMGRAAQAYVDDTFQWSHVADRLLWRVMPEALEGRKPVFLESAREAGPNVSTL